VVIDPIMDFDLKPGRTSTACADCLLACVQDNGLEVDWILKTRAHADPLSRACHVWDKIGGASPFDEHPCRTGDLQEAFT
jgi:hypothetical protein